MNTRNSFAFTTILFFIFLILKLTDYIDWSWFWVVSPLIFGAVGWIIILAVLLTILVKRW